MVEILRGGRSKKLLDNAYDGLPVYAAFDHLGKTEVMTRVDKLLGEGVLKSSGGQYPVLTLGNPG
jgi:hypothetical protein